MTSRRLISFGFALGVPLALLGVALGWRAASGTRATRIESRALDATASRVREAKVPSRFAQPPSDAGAQWDRAPGAHEARRSASTAALQAAVRRVQPAQARLFAAFERAGMRAPDEADVLLQMEAGGSPADEMVAFVRLRFPRDARTRLVAVDWIASVRPEARAGRSDTMRRLGRGTPANPMGTLKKTGD